jgi:hypothetical protein
MPTSASQAIDNATRLSEIGFPEFTAKLITGTFDAITASYIEQMAQYMNVLKAAAQTLSDYVNNTKDDISADEINSFLLALGPLDDPTLTFLLGDAASVGTLDANTVTKITTAATLPAAAGAPTVISGNNLARRDAIREAVARRIAVNKYDLLQTMVRQGLLRLYVDNGTIETRLTFTTYGQAISSSSRTNRTQTEASFTGGAGGGVGALVGNGLFGVGAGITASRSTLTVSTAKESQRDVSGSRVQVFGRVKLNFKTDFVPLAAPQT